MSSEDDCGKKTAGVLTIWESCSFRTNFIRAISDTIVSAFRVINEEQIAPVGRWSNLQIASLGRRMGTIGLIVKYVMILASRR
jgi:hypothetical protein